MAQSGFYSKCGLVAESHFLVIAFNRKHVILEDLFLFLTLAEYFPELLVMRSIQHHTGS